MLMLGEVEPSCGGIAVSRVNCGELLNISMLVDISWTGVCSIATRKYEGIWGNGW